jgi:uncharacterized membrane protein
MFLETLATAIIMLIIDMIWLTARAKYHNDIIRSVQGSDPKIRIIPAILIYVLIPIAVMVFAVLPSTEIETAALRGAFLGLCMYGVYDLTNYATLTNYTLEMTITDMAWGSFLCAAGAAIAYILRRHVFRRQYTMLNLSWLKHFKYQYPQKRVEI